MFNRFFVSSVVAFALVSSGCVVGSVETEELCMIQENVEFPGSATPLLYVEKEKGVALELSDEFNDLLHDESFDTTGTEIKALSLTLTARDGRENFDFVERLRATLTSDTDASAAPIVLVDYEKTEASQPSPWSVPVNSSFNIFQALAGGPSTLTLRVGGTLPADEWHADVKLCVQLKLKARASL